MIRYEKDSGAFFRLLPALAGAAAHATLDFHRSEPVNSAPVLVAGE
ncbi:MAG: hypothetical protein WBN75_20390 [Verrucomicrobiia bacterium]|jgi:hypothetical protein